MSIIKHVSSLLPIIDKRTFANDIADTRNMVGESLPVFEEAAKVFKGVRFKSKPIAAFDTAFVRGVESRMRGNHVELMSQIFAKAKENIDVIDRLNNKHKGDFVRAAISYNKVQLINFIAATQFALRFARKHLNYVLSAETNVMRQSKMIGKELSKGEEQWLKTRQQHFILVMKALDNSPRELEALVAKIPDIEIDETDGEAVIASVGINNLDPMGLGRANFNWSPIYHIRLAFNDWRQTEYELLQDEKKLLEYRLMELKDLNEGKEDPKLQLAIERYQEMVDDASYKLMKMEQS